MDDAEVRALIAEMREELTIFRRQVNIDLTDLQGAVAELADDYDRRLLRPPRQ